MLSVDIRPDYEARRWPLGLAALLAVAALATQSARAAFPEPDVIFYGRVAIDGVQVGSQHDISAHPADPNRPAKR